MRARAVVVGSGSAGRRHAAALRAQLPGTELVVVRRPGSDQPLEPLDHVGAAVVSSLDEALDPFPTVAVVASPAPYHRISTERLLTSGCHVLVEKPLAATIDDAAAMARAATASSGALIVGYHLRFGEVAPEMRRLVRGGIVGEPRSFRFEVGQHLDGWRLGVDPRRSVSARAELGGGVLLELSHELDALRYVLDAEVTEVRSAQLSRTGAPTDGRVDTVADLLLATSRGIAGEVHLDMVSDPGFRQWTIDGDEGTLIADLLTSRILLQSASGARHDVASFPPGERDRAEGRLIRHLIDVAESQHAPSCTPDDGLAAMEIVEAARSSAEAREPVAVLRRREVRR